MLHSVLHRNGDRCTVSGHPARKARRQRGTDRDRVRAEHVASCDVELAVHDWHAARDVAIRAADVQVHRRVGDDHARTISAPRPDAQGSVNGRQVRAAACATGKQRGAGISANRGRGSVTRHVSPVALPCSTVYDRSPSRMPKPATPKLTIRPLTPDLWPTLVDLFGEKGACNGCWCMYWRIGSAYHRRPRASNKADFHAIVRRGPPPGLLAFDGDRAVGWCQVTPRDDVPWLDRTWRLKRVDDVPVWSLSCLYVRIGYRKRGVATALIAAALKAA